MKVGFFRRGLRASVSLMAVAAAVSLSSAAFAHQVWLESDGSNTKLYFGEYGDNQRETSPGYLDKLARPSATLVGAKGEKVLEPTKTRDAVSFGGRAANGDSVVAVDLQYPISTGHGDKAQRSAWTPAARYVSDLRAQTPKLTLDVVPTGKPGEFQVVFRGAPLPKAEVSLVAVSGWSLTGRTDELGKVSFKLPWKGGYAMLVRHKDPTPGKRKTAQGTEEAFDVQSFATTLTFVTPNGLVSPPAPPPAPPNEMPAEAPKPPPAAAPATPPKKPS
jgi:uncharacterized GH25 family protein